MTKHDDAPSDAEVILELEAAIAETEAGAPCPPWLTRDATLADLREQLAQMKGGAS